MGAAAADPPAGAADAEPPPKIADMIFPKMLTTNLHKARNENAIGAPTR
jgi:hypothetical protein